MVNMILVAKLFIKKAKNEIETKLEKSIVTKENYLDLTNKKDVIEIK